MIAAFIKSRDLVAFIITFTLCYNCILAYEVKISWDGRILEPGTDPSILEWTPEYLLNMINPFSLFLMIK